MYELGRGFDNIMIIDATHMLGNLYADQGRLKEAEAMYRRALAGLQTALGPSHSKSQLVMRNIESLQRTIGIIHLYCCM